MKNITALEKELITRERAAPHLRGIPARHNQNAINDLTDRLTALHIARIEGKAPQFLHDEIRALRASRSKP